MVDLDPFSRIRARERRANLRTETAVQRETIAVAKFKEAVKLLADIIRACEYSDSHLIEQLSALGKKLIEDSGDFLARFDNEEEVVDG